MEIVRNIFERVGRLVAGVRVSGRFNKTATGTTTLLAAHATNERNVVIVVEVMETFANGSGGQPTFKLGQTSTTAKYADTTAFTDAVKGTVLTFAGSLTSTKALLVTAVAATGTGTGSIRVEAIVLPATV